MHASCPAISGAARTPAWRSAPTGRVSHGLVSTSRVRPCVGTITSAPVGAVGASTAATGTGEMSVPVGTAAAVRLLAAPLAGTGRGTSTTCAPARTEGVVVDTTTARAAARCGIAVVISRAPPRSRGRLVVPTAAGPGRVAGGVPRSTSRNVLGALAVPSSSRTAASMVEVVQGTTEGTSVVALARMCARIKKKRADFPSSFLVFTDVF